MINAEIMDKMKQSGIPSMIYYGRPMHLQKAFESLGGKQGDIIESEKASNCVMSLPMHPYLTDEQVDEICQKLIEIL